MPNVYALVPMANPQFKPNVTGMLAANQNVVFARAGQEDEVGLMKIKNSSGKKTPVAVIGWSFIFPLKDFGKPAHKKHVKQAIANELFGRVVNHQMMEPVTKLSAVPNAERKNLKITLESR